MYSTIDNTHTKILHKYHQLRKVNKNIAGVLSEYLTEIADKKLTRKQETYLSQLKLIKCNIVEVEIDEAEANYSLSIAYVLNDQSSVKEYHRIIAIENICGDINELAWRMENFYYSIVKSMQTNIINCKKYDLKMRKIKQLCTSIQKTDIDEYLERESDDFCKCGTRYQFVAETSELKCSECMISKMVVGSVFKEEQFNSKETANKTGQEVLRHFKYWLDRTQAIEAKKFDPSDLEKIRYLIKRKGIIKTELTYELMRDILKDNIVSATKLNDNIPSLIKELGGVPPPILTYNERQTIQLRFKRVADIYSELDSGNKPYYPYFIYKIIEEMFKDKPKKLRILNYIHLQSQETVEKNDRNYKKICQVVDDESSGIVYRATNIFKRY